MISKTSFELTHLPCPCGESSDAFAVAADRHGYCFSCSKRFPPSDSTSLFESDNSPTGHNKLAAGLVSGCEPSASSLEFIGWRGVTKETFRHYNSKTRVLEDGQPHSISFTYPNGATKNRLIADKQFWASGKIGDAGLFGRDRFSAGQSRAVTICEGELDALSAFQMLGSKYPVVSVQSATSALRDCTRDFEWLNQFDKIYLCFDNDKPGDQALRKVAALFGYTKVYYVKLGLKDPNEYLEQGKAKEFVSIWYNAKRYLPDNIDSSLSSFKEALREKKAERGIALPFAELDAKLMGLRKGEILLVTAMEGVGKTEIMRALEHNVLKNTTEKLAIIHLEESKARSILALVGYELQAPIHLPESGYTDEQIESTLDGLVKGDDRLFVYSHFGSDDPDSILSSIRFLVTACGCSYVFLDHISIVVSGRTEEDERKTLDYLSTRLAMLVEELNFCLVLVSHVNDEGKTRGSRNISKIANQWIHLTRDLEALSSEDRCTTNVMIKKNRFASYTGPAGKILFDMKTHTLKDRVQTFGVPQ